MYASNSLQATVYSVKTQEGKPVAHLNALKHGLLPQEDLLRKEAEDAFEELGERLRAELRPVGELKGLPMDRIVDAHWRLRRLGRVEAGIFAWELYAELAERAHDEARAYETNLLLDTPSPYETITDERRHEEALSKAQEMKAEQDAETATLGRTFVRDADKVNAFSKPSRYDAAIEQSLYKALHELQRLQAARRAHGDLPPPGTVDLQISGGFG